MIYNQYVHSPNKKSQIVGTNLLENALALLYPVSIQANNTARAATFRQVKRFTTSECFLLMDVTDL